MKNTQSSFQKGITDLVAVQDKNRGQNGNV